MDLTKGVVPVALLVAIIFGLGTWGFKGNLEAYQLNLVAKIREERSKDISSLEAKIDDLIAKVNAGLADKEPFKKPHYEAMRRLHPELNLLPYDELNRSAIQYGAIERR